MILLRALFWYIDTLNLPLFFFFYIFTWKFLGIGYLDWLSNFQFPLKSLACALSLPAWTEQALVFPLRSVRVPLSLDKCAWAHPFTWKFPVLHVDALILARDSATMNCPDSCADIRIPCWNFQLSARDCDLGWEGREEGNQLTFSAWIWP